MTGAFPKGLARITALLAILGAVAGCDRPETETHTPFDPLEGQGSHAPDTGAAQAAPAEPPTLAGVRSEPVVGRTGPGDQPFEVAVHNPGSAGYDRMFGRLTLPVAIRGPEPTAYPCTSCHYPGRQVARIGATVNAHRNMLPRHPDRMGTVCGTCHAPDNVEELALMDGERVPLGHAYRLCAQCHYPQVDDWAAGIHGKRLDGWRGRRVVMGCADCHDPHAPAIGTRVPFPGPVLRRDRRTP